MLDVRSVPDGEEPTVYSVFGFAKLAEAEQERLRQSLFCPSCGGRAYFRRASSDGKAACFGSLYHQDDCKEYRPSNSRKEEEAAVSEVQSVLERDDGLYIDFDAAPSIDRKRPKTSVDPKLILKSLEPQPSAAEPVLNKKPTQKQAQANALANSTETSNRVEANSLSAPVLGLKKVLQSLIRGSELASSNLWVYTDEVHRWRAKNLFVNFANAKPTENGGPRMYWGTISHGDKDMNWLNPVENRELGIAISDIRDALKRRFNLAERRDLEGAGVIIFGKCFYTKDKNRMIIKPWGTDPKWVYLVPSAEAEIGI